RRDLRADVLSFIDKKRHDQIIGRNPRFRYQRADRGCSSENAVPSLQLHGNKFRSDPVAGLKTDIQQTFFLRSFFRPVIVFESNCRWKTHQNTFGAAVRAKPEDRSTVMHQIEFNVTAATDLLPMLVISVESRVAPA